MVIVRNEKTFSYPETYMVLKEKDFAMFAGYRKKIAQRLNAEKIKEMALKQQQSIVVMESSSKVIQKLNEKLIPTLNYKIRNPIKFKDPLMKPNKFNDCFKFFD